MKILNNADLRPWNTFGMRVSCAAFVEYDSVEELRELWHKTHTGELHGPVLHIGRGSNLLFTQDFPGTIFHSGIKFINVLDEAGDGNVKVEVGSGVIWDDFCSWCCEKGLWGPENLSGIPGETGAAAVQNIGAYGVEIKDMMTEVRCFDCITGNGLSFKTKDCHYGYRDSIFKGSAKGRYIVTSVVFSLSARGEAVLSYGQIKESVEKAVAGREVSVSAVREVVLGIRAEKLPDTAEVGSAGSFFKNPVVPFSDFARVESIARLEYGEDYRFPHFDAGSGFVKLSAAWLIDRCGWKGYREGNVGVWDKQPLVLINATGEARPEEILALEEKIQRSVERKFGIRLEPEVEHIGNFQKAY